MELHLPAPLTSVHDVAAVQVDHAIADVHEQGGHALEQRSTTWLVHDGPHFIQECSQVALTQLLHRQAVAVRNERMYAPAPPHHNSSAGNGEQAEGRAVAGGMQ